MISRLVAFSAKLAVLFTLELTDWKNSDWLRGIISRFGWHNLWVYISDKTVYKYDDTRLILLIETSWTERIRPTTSASSVLEEHQRVNDIRIILVSSGFLLALPLWRQHEADNNLDRLLRFAPAGDWSQDLIDQSKGTRKCLSLAYLAGPSEDPITKLVLPPIDDSIGAQIGLNPIAQNP